ncbi:hypothetical protein [Gellertiella hungarica]|uniref:Uncharacterized protein n=1 Tax=Gellertiella hungarica TaxID=1572859 RepID=A0A7W6J2F2_9HYPH|nr:hypothetical protein [Gellertiella hungarica]MBB4063525.1 hypothetical protein [Gellertiella hungarica]
MQYGKLEAVQGQRGVQHGKRNAAQGKRRCLAANAALPGKVPNATAITANATSDFPLAPKSKIT